MDTNKLKRFATEARNKIRQGVVKKLLALGFNEEGEPSAFPQQLQGATLYRGQQREEGFYNQWHSLYDAIQRHGVKQVYEEVAYTWFNRLVAIRILQKNGFIDRVLTFDNPEIRVPHIVSEARQGRFPEMDTATRLRLRGIISDPSMTYEQFALLITAFCQDNRILSTCFGAISDYTLLLLPDDILDADGFVDMLNRLSSESNDELAQSLPSREGGRPKANRADYISDEDFRTTELLGWLYQFYISERKDDVFASFKKGHKAEADDIAPATQIFTPNWIVKYMVQNTLGRIYLDNNPDDTQLKAKWHYLVGDVSHVATSEDNRIPNLVGDVSHVVTTNVSHVATENADHSRVCGETPHPLLCGETPPLLCGETPHPLQYDELTELKVIDPACGSGHILLEAFDLLYDMYLSEFYSREEAITCIFTKNLVGIDLDTRAKQLATFALLLKACQRDRSFLDVPVRPRVMDMPVCHQDTLQDTLGHFLCAYQLDWNNAAREEMVPAFELMMDADSLGSIMRFDICAETRQMLAQAVAAYDAEPKHEKAFTPLVDGFRLILTLTDKYACVIANPPYMGSGNMNEVLSKYVKKNYAEGKADLATVFVQLFKRLAERNGCYAFIIPPSWLFLSAFESLRKGIIEKQSIESMLHLSRGVFGADFGSVATIIRNAEDEDSRGTYFRLVERTFQEFDQKHLRMLFEQTLADHDFKYRFKDYSKDVESLPYSADGNRIYYPNVAQKNFEKIPGCPIGYWVSEKLIDAFSLKLLSEYAKPKAGLATGDNTKFQRLWFEIDYSNIGYEVKDCSETVNLKFKWYPCLSGGHSRKWGNHIEYVVNWANNGYELKHFYGKNGRLASRPQNTQYYFKEGLTWNKISSNEFCVRYKSKGNIFDDTSRCAFVEKREDLFYLIGVLCSKVTLEYLKMFNPTMSFTNGDIERIPLRFIKDTAQIDTLVQENIALSKLDWDSHEMSWDFQGNPLLVGDVSHVATSNVSHVATSEDTCIATEEEVLSSLLCGETPHPLLCSDISSQPSCGETPHPLRFVNKKECIYITGNKLPHWNQAECVQFVTFRLADSLPQSKLEEYGDIKNKWLAEHPRPWDSKVQEEYYSVIGNTMEKWIDAGYGECVLKEERIRNIVANAIMHFNGDHYNLYAFVIMPNHVHALLSPRGSHLVQDIVGSWKKFSAHEINKLLGREGCVWERECFDHMVRTENSYKAKLDYIIHNPQHLPAHSFTLVVGDVSHVATTNVQSSPLCGETPHPLLCEENSSQLSCGETPHPLSLSLEDIVERYKAKWERNFMQLHQNEEELNRQFISIYGLEDELTPDVPLDEITILQQGEISIDL